MKKITLILAFLLALSTVSCGSANSAAIQASGQIEAKEISIAPGVSGLVVEVNVSEGDSVKMGDALLRLDDSLLLSEKQAAQAPCWIPPMRMREPRKPLDTAAAQYQITLEAEDDSGAEGSPARLVCG
ncbi:MAG: biotin/lipoyl-binding protein [Ahrensia sp.]|nr:biotin/lipoyl-binding protein [Ahrensia sp.]